MAADGRGQAPSLAEQLFTEGHRFDFFQAVALLEALAALATSVGEGADPSREAVRFASSVRLSFAPTGVASVERPRPDSGKKTPLMTVQFMGLAGALGPLPAPFAELVLGRALRGDTAGRDFLDIFNHRLVSLVYRIHKRHRIGLGVRSPEADDAARYLYALVGLGTAHLRGRFQATRDRALLHYAGLLAREGRSMVGLNTLLTTHFGVPVEGTPFTGGFYPIERADRTKIGRSGQHLRLGRDTLLGARYWDQEAAFELRIGPLGVEDYLRFVPAGRDHAAGCGDRLAPLCDLVRFYAGPALDFRLRLVLDPKAARGARDGRRAAPPAARVQTLGERPRLGYTAWVGRAWQRREILLSGGAPGEKPRK